MSWLDATIFVPLVGALIVGLIPKGRDAMVRMVALSASLLAFALSLVVLGQFDSGTADFQLGSSLGWVPQWGIRYETGVDGISLWLVLLTTFLMPIALYASWRTERLVKPYFAFLLALETAMLGTFCALDLFLFYLFWEASLVPMYFLIGMWGGPQRLYATVKFFLYTLAGSLLMLAAILYVYFSIPGEPTFGYEALLGTPLSLTAQTLAFLAFFAAFAIKIPLVPLHTWSPDAYAEAPTPVAVVLSGVMLKMGAYGLIRFCIPLFPDAARRLAPFVMVLAIAGILYGALVAVMQKDFKRLIAYSSIAHLGFIVLGIFVGVEQGMSGGIIQMVNHGLQMGALFLLIGMLAERTGSRMIADFGGAARSAPVLAGLFLVVLLAALGLPGLNGFVGEFLILLGAYSAYSWWAVPAVFGIVLAAVYMLWAYQRMFHGPVRVETRRVVDIRARELVLVAPLVAFIVFIGVFPQPFLDRINPAAQRAVKQMETSVLPSGGRVARSGGASGGPVAGGGN
jgi:NADH-quinone oxidoreductase subunit M